MKYAHPMSIVGRNPMDKVDDPGAPQADPTSKAWTMEQTMTFLSSVAGDRLHALWWLAAWTGMRRGELLGLRWSDVDLDSGVVSIRRTWVQVDGTPQESTPKTPQGRRAVEIDDRTVSILRRHRTAQVQERLARSAWEDTDHLFVWEDGRPLRPDWTSRRFDHLVRRTDLPVIPLHGLRHSHATALLTAGVHPKVVQERL
ncbi:MAG: site-specific integrase [Acidimicrobiia bacterium]|nr:site-specific integrase [Acidimicrobiia bacterium]